jgi:hypothetical protein
MNIKGRKRHKARWVEGLDWVRVSDILDLDDNNPEVGERIWRALLTRMFGYLPDVSEVKYEALMEEARRRFETGEMPPDHAEVI